MRSPLLFAALVLAACHGGGDRGPAWPKSAGTVIPDDAKDDGGESLEPHPHHVAALEVAGDDTPSAGAEITPDPAATPTGATTGTPIAPVVETIEIQLEDIQIGPGGDLIISP